MAAQAPQKTALQFLAAIAGVFTAEIAWYMGKGGSHELKFFRYLTIRHANLSGQLHIYNHMLLCC